MMSKYGAYYIKATHLMRPPSDQKNKEISNSLVNQNSCRNIHQDLKSWASVKRACRFNSGPGHHLSLISYTYSNFHSVKRYISRPNNWSIYAYSGACIATTMRPNHYSILNTKTVNGLALFYSMEAS